MLIAASAMQPAFAAASDIKALYNVTFAGFLIAKGTLGIRLKGGAYAAKVQISTSGLARIISSEESEASSRGSLSSSRVIPASYDLYSKGDKITEVDMKLRGSDVTKVRAYPQLSQADDRVPVTAASKRNVVDPLSAVVMPIRSADGAFDPDACDRVLPIFDGWTRYDIKLAYKDRVAVESDGYTGDAVVCSARWIPVSGHRANKKSTLFMQDNRDLEMWLIPAADASVLVPYKISVKTMRGTLQVVATRFEGADTTTTQAAK
ncbi:DUF3108 domain-containing protein [Hartmannibacter diazotrophicus]|nr:DUF3108 domain-containing protein [Hartmannibacter diazotrophicus]